MAKYSDRSQAPNASHAILTDTEYKSAADPDRIVPSEDRIKAYKVCNLAVNSTLSNSCHDGN